MSEEIKSIHDFDLEIIIDYFANLERQGPGGPEITQKALSFIDNLTSDSKIVDLGCGTGGQTITLAQNAPGTIVGSDIFPKFINLFNKNIEKFNLQDRVKSEIRSMADPFAEEESLDLIWCEGAIYNVGFERGLNEWRKFLKTGGYIAVSEGTWFTEERPEEIQKFWDDVYPEIDTISNKVAQMQKAGYIPVATFVFPEYCWLENHFAPAVEVQKRFLEEHPNNEAVAGFVANQRHEFELYKKYKDYYGYVFYIGKKI